MAAAQSRIPAMTPANPNRPAGAHRQGFRLYAALLSALLVGACSSGSSESPDAKEDVAAEEEARRRTPVREGPAPITAEERERMAETLVADREGARYTEGVIRLQTAETAPPPVRAPTAASAGRPLATIRFAGADTALDSAGRRALRRLAAAHRRTDGPVRVIGHAHGPTRETDRGGDPLPAFRLSLDRANAVAQSLMSMGVPARSISIRTLADELPGDTRTMASGEVATGRVEVYLDRPG